MWEVRPGIVFVDLVSDILIGNTCGFLLVRMVYVLDLLRRVRKPEACRLRLVSAYGELCVTTTWQP